MTTPSSPPSGGGTLFDPGSVEGPTLTVPELAAQIARLTAQAFPTDMWVSGQIRNLSRSANGHVYFDLVEPTEGGVTPRSMLSVTLLAPERAVVNRQITRAGGSIRMEDGIEVRIQARLRWYEPRGTLQLRMSGIDPAFTLGRLKADRDRVLAALRAEGLLDANAANPVPIVPLRIALITSKGSAAHADVMSELDASGFAFQVRLYDVRTQGEASVGQVVGALARVADGVADRTDPVDVVLLTRGGGATTDLATFDAEDLARAIAALPVPVLTGIGHEIDRSVADEVAHTACKTPTAAAAALVTMVAAYLSRIDQCWERGRQAALTATAAADRRLDRRRQRVAKGVERVLRVEDARLVSTNARVARAAHRSVTHATAAVDRSAAAVRTRSTRAVEVAGRDLDGLAARVRAHDPVHALARGWSITTDQQGRAVRSITGLEAGAVITTRVADGTLTSKVIATTPATTDSATTAPDPVPGAPDE
ncbi:MAG: exodeoxyribonuclease VII large subunit [Acidimicrobiales bacterium]|nr:exodeoxyribonuclease VII large subunit [Acidimicrobiales bacterium]